MRPSPIAKSTVAECSPTSRFPSLRSAPRDLDPVCAPGWCLIVGDGRTEASGGGSRLRSGWRLWSSYVTDKAHSSWLAGLLEGYRELTKHSRPSGPGDCEGSLAPRAVALKAMVRESVSEMAAQALVGPQHAPSPASGSPKVRMEARRAGGFSRLGNDRRRRVMRYE